MLVLGWSLVSLRQSILTFSLLRRLLISDEWAFAELQLQQIKTAQLPHPRPGGEKLLPPQVYLPRQFSSVLVDVMSLLRDVRNRISEHMPCLAL